MESTQVTSFFRRVAYAEGVSFLILLGIAMPLKYVYGQPLAVKCFGWVHGVFFLLYLYAANRLAKEAGWPGSRLWLAFGAAVVPFGPFFFDRRVLRK